MPQETGEEGRRSWASEERRRPTGMAGPSRQEQMEREAAGIPILGWLSGAGARADALQRQREQEHRDRLFGGLLGSSTGIGSATYASEGLEDELGSLLNVGRDEYGDLIGDRSEFETWTGGYGGGAQQRALDELLGLYRDGGYTDADRAVQAANRAMIAQQMGAANQAAMQQAQARGMSNSGALLAQQQANAQNMAGAQMMQDAQMQQAAMNRALSALGQYQQLGTTMRGQDERARAAIDAFNRANTDWRRGRAADDTAWRRGRETRATEAVNKTREAAAQADQQAFENRLAATTAYANANNAANQGSQETGAEGIDGLITGIVGAVASDARLKTDIRLVGHSPSGIPEYEFRYKAAPATLYRGAMAQDLLLTHPQAVVTGEDGFYQVRYDMLDVDFSKAGAKE